MNAEVSQATKAQEVSTVRLSIPAQALEAARLCMGKRDVRYYLNGIRINDKRISGTNGHVLYDHAFNAPIVLDDSLPFDREIILMPQSAVPASASTAIIELFHDFALIKYYKRNYGSPGDFIKADFAHLIDGKFPDVDRILGPLKGEPEPTKVIGFKSEYLALAQKIFGRFSRFGALKMVMHGERSAAHFEHDDVDTGKHYFVVMPLRL